MTKFNETYNVGKPNKEILAVFAVVKVIPGKEDFFKKEMEKIIPLTLNEEGAYCYLLHESTNDNCEFTLYEQWESQEHLHAHLNSEHMSKFFNAVKDIMQSGYPQIKTYKNII
ncbi:putative quinol monooxygenase [Pigmentibacter sp. JX0631]|uniref:putative quinol monooxygenase n=1 Tax=Pigmentibacter sp. JX0631 TaxID=2976982 RepID=UPI0024689879|nr:putative quinol monooxygenase [Pigmentibacter sp. JX0631]WGL59801.1 putative quinol monooxygenase [Pigmentibacter sp. JX0631]